jgi:hypothetical protein
MENKSPQLKDGSEWIDHEDCLVGDEQGLKNLIAACNTAIEKGEYFGSDLGDYVGVKKIETQWFKEDPKDTKKKRFANVGMAFFLMFVFGIFLVGLVTVIKLLF